MAYIKGTSYTCGTAKHNVTLVNVTPQLDMVNDPIMVLEGISACTVVNAVVIIADTAFTDGTDPITYTLELHSQDIQDPVTTGTRLVTNMGITAVTAGAAQDYTYSNLGQQIMIPIRMVAKKSAASVSIRGDAQRGEEKYDVVLRANAKAAQAGTLSVITLSFQAYGPDMAPGTTGSCCVTGFTPSSN